MSFAIVHFLQVKFYFLDRVQNDYQGKNLINWWPLLERSGRWGVPFFNFFTEFLTNAFKKLFGQEFRIVWTCGRNFLIVCLFCAKKWVGSKKQSSKKLHFWAIFTKIWELIKKNWYVGYKKVLINEQEFCMGSKKFSGMIIIMMFRDSLVWVINNKKIFLIDKISLVGIQNSSFLPFDISVRVGGEWGLNIT